MRVLRKRQSVKFLDPTEIFAGLKWSIPAFSIIQANKLKKTRWNNKTQG